MNLDDDLSINALASLTGLDRRTIAARLTGVSAVSVKANEKRYRLRDAIPALVRVPDSREGSESESRRRLNDARRVLAELQVESLRKDRVPLAVCSAFNDHALQSIAGILKARVGKILDDESLQDCFAELRGIGEKLRAEGYAVDSLTEETPQGEHQRQEPTSPTGETPKNATRQ